MLVLNQTQFRWIACGWIEISIHSPIVSNVQSGSLSQSLLVETVTCGDVPGGHGDV
jgi:hypothetical protein